MKACGIARLAVRPWTILSFERRNEAGAADQTRTGPKSLEGSCATTTPQPHSVAEVMPATTVIGPAVFGGDANADA